MPDNEQPDKYGTAEGARQLALDTVIRALVDHASLADPGFRERAMTGIEDYIARLDPQSELQADFAERARGSAAVLLGPGS
ncbi:hypothetical protein ABVB70_22560 [Agrobacterium radiobacter]|jgi:hypothetical protein|uniref:Uncharacterized protein n=1 Tax=Agrobacterium radiobacter TaxID=362 RepID=A0ABD5LMU6_AGRRD|nr:hypothetical protein [Agrobacterium tumefaciens]MCP2137900.1 hypothetical protein [Rhizobium sp. SLBN-94]MDP9791248.1 hypothetical protein [Agrobacterium tumefaciens]CUX55698.1 conserved hypothetical protein [Agrobacterium tumefaciens str. CFBP 5621]